MKDAPDATTEVPPFAKDYPDSPELRRLVDAFGRGDYKTVRDGTAALANSEDEAVRRAAKDLRARTEADPFAKIALLLTLLLLGWLTFYWEQHDGKRNLEPDRPSPSTAPASK